MRTETLTLAGAMDVLARDIHCEDGIATAAIAEAADRLRELHQEVIAAQFWREHAQRTNAEFEADYLAIWKAVKEPDKTVLDSVLALKARAAKS